MEEASIIKEAISPWSLPIVLALKKGSKPGEFTPRLCTDYQRLNEIIKKDCQPLPLINNVLMMLEDKVQYYTTLNLYSGFNQIGLTKEASDRSAFITPDRTYICLLMNAI